MQTSVPAIALACLLSVGASAQSTTSTTTANDAVSVRIPVAVLADGKPLPPGQYILRFTGDQPGQLAGTQQAVEILAGGKVVARETAEVLRDDDLPAVGASSQIARGGPRVEMLRGGEFLRISIRRDGARYLVHLPTVREKASEQG